MSHAIMVWTSLTIYVLITLYIAVRGAKKTGDLKSFALGNRDIAPSLVGLSLTAQLTSVATFVVNPALVYQYGISALFGLGFAAGLGITTGLILLSGPFRNTGDRIKALTIPQWIGARYDSKGLRLFFAFLSLSLISFIVLIAVALTLTLFSLLQMTDISSATWLLIVLMAFVFSYTLSGGANTSTYTNAIQAIIMLVVGLILIGSGLNMLWQGEGLFARLAAIDPNLVTVINPASAYFRNFFEVFICNFIVGVAIVCQPHILGKSLLLKDSSQIRRYLIVALVAGTVFMSVMIVGLYARVNLTGLASPDHSVPVYIATTFPTSLQVLISIGLLCAGISTLEGLLLALSTIFSSDIYLSLKPPAGPEDTAESFRRAFRFGRIASILVGIGCVFLSVWQIRNPTGGSVAIFGQYGVYLLFTATFLPIACGVFFDKVGRSLVTWGVIASVTMYFLPMLLSFLAPEHPALFMANNPAFLAFCGITAGWITVGGGVLFKSEHSETVLKTAD